MKTSALGMTIRNDSTPAILGLSMSLRHSDGKSGIFCPNGICDLRISCCNSRRTTSHHLPAAKPSDSSLPSARRRFTSRKHLTTLDRNCEGTFLNAVSNGELLFEVLVLVLGILVPRQLLIAHKACTGP